MRTIVLFDSKFPPIRRTPDSGDCGRVRLRVRVSPSPWSCHRRPWPWLWLALALHFVALLTSLVVLHSYKVSYQCKYCSLRFHSYRQLASSVCLSRAGRHLTAPLEIAPLMTAELLASATGIYSVRQKKYPLKFFCHFLSNRSEFLYEISHIYYSFIIT